MKCSKCGKRNEKKDICFAARMEHLVLLMRYRGYFKMRKKQMVLWR